MWGAALRTEASSSPASPPGAVSASAMPGEATVSTILFPVEQSIRGAEEAWIETDSKHC